MYCKSVGEWGSGENDDLAKRQWRGTLISNTICLAYPDQAELDPVSPTSQIVFFISLLTTY